MRSALPAAPSPTRSLSVAAVENRVSESDFAAAMRSFGKLRDRQQREVLAAMRAAVGRLEDPFLASLARYSRSGAKAGKSRIRALKVRGKNSAKRAPRTLGDQLPFAARSEYRFAYGDIVSRETTFGSKRQSRRKRDRARLAAEIRDLCAGQPLDVDRALAAMLRELDSDRSADSHAVLLDCWREGSQTLYQAMAESGRTGRSVFFFDAMLSDWMKRCVPKRHPERKMMIRSLTETRQAFAQMAKTYRSYRSAREVIALSLILAPDEKLPKSLSLYDQNGSQPYSCRDVIVLLLAAHRGDVGKTVETILAHAEAMPKDTWHGGYAAVEGIYATHKAILPKLRARGSHTDQLLREQKLQRVVIKDRIAQVARRALVLGVAKNS